LWPVTPARARSVSTIIVSQTRRTKPTLVPWSLGASALCLPNCRAACGPKRCFREGIVSKRFGPTLSCRPVNPRTRPCATRVYISGGNPCRSDTSKTRRRERRRFVERSNPFAFWIQAARIAWLPWLGATRLMLPRAPITALPKLDQENPD